MEGAESEGREGGHGCVVERVGHNSVGGDNSGVKEVKERLRLRLKLRGA
jgi:hypothetical protein